MYLPVPVCFLCNERMQTPNPTHSAKVRHLQVQTDCSVHTLGAAFGLHSRKPLFYLINIFRQFLFAPSTYYCNHRLPTGATDWQREMTNNSCQVKCGCNPSLFLHRRQCHSFVPTLLTLGFCISQFMFSFILHIQILLLLLS